MSPEVYWYLGGRVNIVDAVVRGDLVLPGSRRKPRNARRSADVGGIDARAGSSAIGSAICWRGGNNRGHGLREIARNPNSAIDGRR
jgi:hypothetical protein